MIFSRAIDFFKKLLPDVTSSIIARLVMAVLALLFGHFSGIFESLGIIIRYFVFEFWFFGIILAVFVALFGSFLFFTSKPSFIKIKKYTKHISLIFVFIFFALNIFLLWEINKCDPQIVEEYRQLFLGFLTLDENGNYSYSSPHGTVMEDSFAEYFLDEKIFINKVTDSTLKSNIYYEHVPEHILSFYNLFDIPLTKLLKDHYTCNLAIRWFEIDPSANITNVGFFTRFIIVQNGNLDNSIQLKRRVNRFSQIENFPNALKGEYLGRIYKAFNEAAFVNHLSGAGEYDKALISIDSQEKELLEINNQLQAYANTISGEDKKKLEMIIEEDESSWLFITNQLRFYVFWSRKDFTKAEQYLEKMFNYGLSVNGPINLRNFFDSFLNMYTGAYRENLTIEDAEEIINSNGFTSKIDPPDYDIETFDQILGYKRSNPTFDYENFFIKLSEKHPNNPIIYMYWAKLLTTDGKYLEGANLYRKSFEIYPDADVLHIFYYTALINSLNKKEDGGLTEQELMNYEEYIRMLIELLSKNPLINEVWK